MPRLPHPRASSAVQVRQRPLNFSYWPMYRGTRRYGLQSSLFVSDPWTVIKSRIRDRCSTTYQPEAVASLEQAQDFYNASASARIAAAKPLLLYYCFMN